MKTSSKRIIGALAATSLLAAAPVAAQGGDRSSSSGRSYGGGSYGGGSYGGGSYGGGSYGGGSYGRGSLDVVGLTADARLIKFNEFRPRDARTIGRISGLVGDTKLVGIDYRPATGVLYGLGDQGGVYTLDSSAAATKRAQLGVALQGTSFGVDFNPAVDRLRIISDTGQNLRIDVTTGMTMTDGTLTYPPATTAATGVTGAAYTNNDADPNTATTLFDIDSTLDQVAIQSPANSGQLAPTGKLGVDTSGTVGSDIYSTIRNGTTVKVRGAAALTVGGKSRFYGIDILQGRANDRGAFSKDNQVTGIAIPLNQL